MRILRQTPEALTLSLCPLRMWILSGALTAVGLSILLGLGRMTTLRCDRLGLALGTCSVDKVSLWQDKRQTINLTQVYSADIDWLYRIVLHTEGKTIPLTFPYAAIDWKQQIVMNQINEFLDNPIAVQLKMTQDGRSFAYPFGTSFFLGGLVLACYFGSVAIYEINQAQQTVILKHRGVLGQSSRKFHLSDIETLQLESSDYSSPTISDCQVSLRLRSGQCISLTPRYPLDRHEANHLVHTLQAFLKH